MFGQFVEKISWYTKPHPGTMRYYAVLFTDLCGIQFKEHVRSSTIIKASVK